MNEQTHYLHRVEMFVALSPHPDHHADEVRIAPSSDLIAFDQFGRPSSPYGWTAIPNESGEVVPVAFRALLRPRPRAFVL